MFWSTVIGIALLIAVIYVIHKIRSTTRENRLRSEERAAAMLIELQRRTGTRNGEGATAVAPSTPIQAQAPAVQAQSATAPAPPTGLTRRARILTDGQRLLYLALRAALPDHTIMAHIRVADLLEPPQDPATVERDARLRELARQRLDFVACNRELVPVAAMVLYEAGIAAVPDESIKVDALRELGVRFLRFRADSLPRPAELRSLILG